MPEGVSEGLGLRVEHGDGVLAVVGDLLRRGGQKQLQERHLVAVGLVRELWGRNDGIV